MNTKVKWILFDFGGCLDSDGIHSRALFLEQFEKFHLISKEKERLEFQDAYTFSDRTVTEKSLVLNSGLLEMNDKMCYHIASKLNINNTDKVSTVARAITGIQSGYLRRNKEILKQLNERYRLGIVSNFSGNLALILNEFNLNPLFSFVLDSYHVGLKKPDPGIFELALKQCEVQAGEICYIGDSVEKDIAPARSLGMKTILISRHPINSGADYTLSSLEELLEIIHII